MVQKCDKEREREFIENKGLEINCTKIAELK
jgi:hypothetical protein